MKFKLFLSLFLMLSFGAKALEINNLRTDLYSKAGNNQLKKIELSLEFENLDDKNQKKLTDSVLTVISGFFYEDIFTESGKNNFKKSLSKFVDKKYKIKLDEIYFLKLSGVEKFDLDEFKRFLQSSDAKQNTNELKKALDELDNLEIKPVEKVSEPKVEAVQTPIIAPLPIIDEEKNENDINIEALNTPKLSPELNEKIAQEIINNAKLMNQKSENNESSQNQDLKTLPQASFETNNENIEEPNAPLNSKELEEKLGEN